MTKTNNKEREEAIKFKIMARLWMKCFRRQEQNEHLLLLAIQTRLTTMDGWFFFSGQFLFWYCFISIISLRAQVFFRVNYMYDHYELSNHIRNIRTRHYLVEFELTVAIFVTETNLQFEILNYIMLLSCACVSRNMFDQSL